MGISGWIEQNFGGQLLRVHDAVYQRSNGRIGHRLPGAPPSYARDGDTYLIVASLGGAPRSPGWYHNLKADPNVDINVGPRRFAVTARPVLPDDTEYARLWQIVNANNANRYAAYQRRTTRPIPIVVLTPR